MTSPEELGRQIGEAFSEPIALLAGGSLFALAMHEDKEEARKAIKKALIEGEPSSVMLNRLQSAAETMIVVVTQVRKEIHEDHSS